MPPFRIKTQPSNVKIKIRMMELFETIDELQTFFLSILPENSLLNTILKIDTIQDKDVLCDTLLAYLGNNFFVYVGKVRPDKEKIEENDVVPTKIEYDILRKKLKSSVEYSDSERTTWERYVRNYEIKKGIDPTHIVRENLLEQYLKFFKDDDGKQRRKIIDRFNSKKAIDTQVTTIHDLSKHPRFLGSWKEDLCNDFLLLPTSIVEPPPSAPKLETTIPLRQNYRMPRLYDFQVESLLEIHNMLNNEKDSDEREQRILLNLPTGAGKTRLTVQSVIEWLNNRDRGLCENARDQQKQMDGENYQGIIFWFASTNELCAQASESFKEVFSHIGTASRINLTNWFGDNRGDLKNICEQNPGTHIVITNTNHTSDKLKEYNDNSEVNRYLKYLENPHVQKIRENTIAIIIDEAHEVGSKGYQNFLGAMGFDFYKTKRGLDKKIYNTQNIVLIGLTATPYKGSGFNVDEPPSEDHESFGKTLDYMKSLDEGTRKIHETFGGIYIPLPDKSNLDSPPTAVIDVPRTGREKDKIKIDGSYSFDHYSELSFFWKIYSWDRGMIYETPRELKTDQSDFYFSFRDEQKYTIELTVINAKGVQSIVHKKITIYPKDNSFTIKKKSLASTKEFYEILVDKKILCKIIHGVIKGPTTNMSSAEERKWKLGSGESDDGEISNDVAYNTQLCDIVDKCRNFYKKDRILIFANGVKHSQELMLILKTVYKHKDVESIDSGTKPGVRRNIVNKFKKGDIHILCNFAVLTTGFDVPEIDVVIIARDVASNSLYTQMIGRGQRGEKAGGTPDVWLITSKFPRHNASSNAPQLGWEALAENWEKFQPEIRDNLGLIDYTHEIRSSGTIETKKLKNNNFVINFEPILDLKLKCKSCGITTQGFKNCLHDYNYSSNNWDTYKIQNIIIGKLKNESFFTTCKLCRISITEKFRNSKCKFTKYLANHHQLNPILILMMKCIHENQRKNMFVVAFETMRNDIKNYMLDDQIPNDFITHTTAIVKQLEEKKFLRINPNYTVQFISKIDDFETSKSIINILEEDKNFKIRLKYLIKNYKQGSTQTRVTTYDELDDKYYKLKKELGHIPTKRQYQSILSLEPELKTKFQQLYDDDYLQFINNKREIIKDDGFLRDSLYDEYFAKCIIENTKISHEQLDKTGDYRIEDYLDIWTTLEKFEKRVHPIIESVLKNYEDYYVKRDSEFKEIGDDILQLKKKIPSNYYHFDTILKHSSISIFRYIIQLKISHLQFLKNYNGKFPGIFLQLVSDFFKLKNWVGIIPNIDKFIELTDPQLTNVHLMQLFGIENSNSYRYSKFLKLLSINQESDNEVEQKEIHKQVFLNKIKLFSKDDQSKLINSTFDYNNELSVQMKMYFPDKKELQKLLGIT